MIQHIFKKDWKLFRFHALLLALFQLANVVVLLFDPLSLESGNGLAGMLHIVLPLTALAGGVALLVALCHEEAIPGVRQDWLVRPISRRDLVVSKVLSALIMVHLPMLAVDVLYGLGSDFPVMQSVAAALSRNILILVTITLPALAVASVSRNFSESVAIALALSSIAYLFLVGARSFRREIPTVDATAETGVAWIPTTLAYGLVFVAIIAVLSIQYKKRKTFLARIVVGVAAIVFWMVALFTPWETAFAIESRLSSRPDAGNDFTLSFDPTIGRLKRLSGPGRGPDSTLYIPVRVNGLPPDSIARVDLADSYSVDELGKTKHFSRDTNLDLHNNGPNYLPLQIDALNSNPLLSPYNDPLVRNNPFQLEMMLFVTLLRATQETPLPGLLGPVRNPVPKPPCGNWFSSFGTPWEEEGDITEGALRVRCMPVIAQPPCVTLVLMNLPQPYVLRPSLTCYRDYGPHYGYLAPGGEVVNAVALIGDPSGKVRYPLGLNDMTATQGFLRWYKPVDHFTVKVVIPKMNFQDWTSENK